MARTARRNADDDPGLPIKLNPVSNGEYLPQPTSPIVREAVRRAREDAERNARRLGMSRRDFLLTSMGAATTLMALAACTKEAAQSGTGPGATPGGTKGSTPGGTYQLPADAGTDADAAIAALGGKEFIMDVQTHFLDGNHDIPDLGLSKSFPQQACGEQDPRDCFTLEKYLDLMYTKSDTNIVVLSALPFAGGPLNPDVMKKAVDTADKLCQGKRLLMQGEAHPSNGPVAGLLDNMDKLHGSLPVGAWKTYTHLGGPGWYLDDHDASAPQVGEAFLRKVAELGPKLVAVHKGFGNGSKFADPVDVGPAAAKHKDINFVIYHSGFEVQSYTDAKGATIAARPEGPYREEDNWGVNRLITSVKKAGIGPGGNVNAELGSTWKVLMASPEQAAHVIGKLLVHFGENNICWGTDSIWYGTPQDQIQAFRAFSISRQFQDQYGYPELTPKIKAKIFGLNSSRLYGVNPITDTCRIDPADMEKARQISYQETGEGNYTLGPTTADGVMKIQQHELAELNGWI